MIQKTQAEKEAIKAAKRAYKEKGQPKIYVDLKVPAKAPPPVYILSGFMEGETILDDDHPVHWDYLYVVDDAGGKVIRSDIQGTVKQLRQDLKRQGYTADTIRRCNMSARNFF